MSRAWFNNAARWSSSSRTLAMLKEPVAVNAKVQGHRHMGSDLRPKVIDRRRLRPNWPAPMLQQAAADVGETRLGSWGAAAGSFSHDHPYPFGQPGRSSMPVSWATGARPGPAVAVVGGRPHHLPETYGRHGIAFWRGRHPPRRSTWGTWRRTRDFVGRLPISGRRKSRRACTPSQVVGRPITGGSEADLAPCGSSG
jgi:hypothetical protein